MPIWWKVNILCIFFIENDIPCKEFKFPFSASHECLLVFTANESNMLLFWNFDWLLSFDQAIQRHLSTGFVKKIFWNISQNSQENTYVASFLQVLANFTSEGLHRWRFPMKFTKFFRKSFYRTRPNDCFWNHFSWHSFLQYCFSQLPNSSLLALSKNKVNTQSLHQKLRLLQLCANNF